MSHSDETDDIRAQAKRAATLYDETLAQVQASPVGSVERRLHSALGDLAHVLLSPDPQDREAAIRDARQGNRYLRERDRMLAEGDDMCPNCLTPWKCNGPHIPPGSARR